MADPAIPEWVPDFPPVSAARTIAAAAQAAARAWSEQVGPGEVVLIGAHLRNALTNLSRALYRLSKYQATARLPGRRYDDPSEPNVHIECAAAAAGYAGRDLLLALSGHFAWGTRPDSPALAAAERLAGATRKAYLRIDTPSGSAVARDVSVSAFMKAVDSMDAALENLAAHASPPLSALLGRQRVRLEQAHVFLREALVASAVGRDEGRSLAIAQSMRERHPTLPHRSPSHQTPGNRSANPHQRRACPGATTEPEQGRAVTGVGRGQRGATDCALDHGIRVTGQYAARWRGRAALRGRLPSR
jgi:hypothetical protein